MALECQNHKTSLHELGRKALESYHKGTAYPRYKGAKTAEDEPIVPDPGVFATLSTAKQTISSDGTRLPTIGECATHLELLETFFVLRQRILRSDEIDGIYGIAAIPQKKRGKQGDTKLLKDETLWERRQVKWPKFIEIAVVRFLVWKALCERDVSNYKIPPVDVLMVWHAFLLNPRLFRVHCGEGSFYRRPFPWSRVHKAINNSDWTFMMPQEAAEMFEEKTGLSTDLLEELSSWKASHEAPFVLSDSMKYFTSEDRPDIPAWVSSLPAENQIRKHFNALHLIDSDLAVQLRDAVLRQASFVEKMNSHLWIRSPGLHGILNRAIDRYSKFLRLMKLYPTTMFVPTLDIDLAWHTHQCTPMLYLKGTKLWAGRFINHDDTIVKDTLDDGFDKTKRLFRVHFGKEYKVCGCWDCEALLSALEHPEKDQDGIIKMESIVKDVADEVAYYRAIETARRKKQPLPIL